MGIVQQVQLKTLRTPSTNSKLSKYYLNEFKLYECIMKELIKSVKVYLLYFINFYHNFIS